MKTTRLMLGVGAAALSSIWLMPAMTAAAQDQPPAAEEAGDEEIVVTAQRRSEKLMKVPIAISVATKTEILDSGAGTTRDLSQVSTGLTSTTNGLAFQPAVRAITTTGTSAGDESNIALYIDGVYLAAQAGNVFNLKNIERIEVLKGPQGTLFGRNATGGAIRVVTSDPSYEPEFHLSANYGTELQSQDFNLYATTGITDDLAIGITANVYDDKGYIDSILPGWQGGKFGTTSSWYVRTKLLWEPADNLKFVLSGDTGRYQSDTQFVLAPVDRINSSKNNPAVILPSGPYQYSGNLAPIEEVETSGVSLTAELVLQQFTVTSITSYRNSEMYGVLDVDRANLLTSVANASNNFDWFTQEVVFASELAGNINFIAGLYYYKSMSGIPRSEAFTNGPVYVNGALTSLGTLASSNQGYVDTESAAVFGEVTWQATDAFKIIAGLRYTIENKALETIPVLPVRPKLRDAHSWDNVSYRLTAQYDISESTNVYAVVSTGFKTGQYNATSPTFVQRVEPEEVQAFEVGLKSRITPDIDFAGSIYYYLYDNIQLQSNNFINGANQIILANAAEATIFGGDFDLTARLAEGLKLNVGVSYLPTAEYDKFPGGLDSVPKGYPGSLNPSLCPSNPQCGAGNDQIIRDLSGTRMIRAPEFTLRLGLAYETTIAEGQLRLSANYFYSDEFFWVTGEHISQPAYNYLNARASWTTPDGHYTFSVWGRNLTDELYSIYTSPNAAGVAAAYAAPLEIGFGLDIDF